VRGQRHAPAAPYPRERPGTHCTGGWVGLRAGLDLCGKSRPTGIRSPDRPARKMKIFQINLNVSRIYWAIFRLTVCQEQPHYFLNLGYHESVIKVVFQISYTIVSHTAYSSQAHSYWPEYGTLKSRNMKGGSKYTFIPLSYVKPIASSAASSPYSAI